MRTVDLYHREAISSAYSLRWSWTGWPSQGIFPTLDDRDWNSLAEAWEQDGIRLLERKCESGCWQATVSSKPNVVPTVIVGRLKGRIDHRFRTKGITFKFSRKVSLRALGDNTVNDVQDYIRRQVDTAQFCDPDFAVHLKQFTRVWSGEEYCQAPVEVTSGRYWYQMHLVLVVEGRYRIRDLPCIGAIFEASQAIALDRGYSLASIAVMPDHLHLSLRGSVSESPETIALTYLNETCRKIGCRQLWLPGYYAGTIGAYNMNAVRM